MMAPPRSAREGVAAEVEALARDLLALARGVRVYPGEHPFLRDLGTRLVSRVRGALPDPLSLGVTPNELVVEETFVGRRHRRAGELAALLHRRRVLRVLWTREATPEHVIALAEILADPARRGVDLRRALHRRKVYTLDLEPLELERIHQSFREEARAPSGEPGRGREAWVWLLNGEAPPDKVAELLTSERFWDVGEGSEASGLTALLVRMGERLEAALSCLPAERRQQVEGRLVELGQEVSPRELAAVIQTPEGGAGDLEGSVFTALERSFRGERLVDLLAGLVALEGRNTRRLAEVYRRFAPGGDPGEILPVVRARLASPERGGFAVDVWEAVESFLLSLEEDPFMAAEYATSLDTLAGDEEGGEGAEWNLEEGAEDHLDRVVVALSLEGGAWERILLDRLAAAVGSLPAVRVLEFAAAVDRERPEVLDRRPGLAEQVLKAGLAELREVGPRGRQHLLSFGLTHEAVVLDPVLRVLGEEEKIAVRRFLVELVSRFSPAATPAIVTRIRSAPWYVTRNLTIALGRKGEAVAVPVLRSLLEHDHPKVRREAVLALGQIGGDDALAALRGAGPSERGLAARTLRSLASRPEEGA